MNIDLAGKHALVTGASRGIGLAVARSLASEGCHLHLAARDAQRLETVRTELCADFPGIEVHTYQADLSRPADQVLLAKQCDQVDILVNNAGAIPRGDIEQTPIEVWHEAWDLKVFGFINLSRLLFLEMKKRRQGVIANIIGTAGERLQPQYIVGSTGNAALIAFTRTMGSLSVDHGVRVVGISPSLTATERGIMILQSHSEQKYGTPDRWREIEADMGLPFGRMASVADVADAVTFMVSPRASYISGMVLNVDGGSTYRHE
ncbi:MAG: short-chain dehydrogenase/reductase [Alcaligenaceae bacterium]|nr:short-chain dehydrogenase/reductase [Alcaligenaceae bacterium]